MVVSRTQTNPIPKARRYRRTYGRRARTDADISVQDTSLRGATLWFGGAAVRRFASALGLRSQVSPWAFQFAGAFGVGATKKKAAQLPEPPPLLA